MENRATTTGRFSCNEPQVSNTPKMSEEKLRELIAELLEATRTEEFAEGVRKRIQEENERYEAYEREQRMLWHRHKNDVYDI